MTQLIAYPFTITPGGRVATVDHDTSVARGQQLAVLVATNIGERVLVPAFGIPDPAFRGVNVEDVRAGVELFGPPVDVTAVTAAAVEAGSQKVRISFDD